MTRELKTYPELRGLLAKYNHTIEDLGKIIGKSESSANMKISDTVKFSLSECKAVRDYFRKLGETGITADKIFFDWQSTIVDKEGT